MGTITIPTGQPKIAPERVIAGGLGGRLLAMALIIVAAVLTLATGLDRVAATRAAPTLPGIRGQSADRQAAILLGAGQLDQAEARAIDYIKANPADARGPSLLGAVQLASGDTEWARKAFAVAGSLGWRDRTTQMFLIADAMQNGRLTTAAQRLNALMRTGTSGPIVTAYLAKLEETTSGRDAVSEVLSANPAWKDEQLLALDTLPLDAIERRIDTVRRAEGRGMRPDCDKRRNVVAQQFAAGAVGVAAGMWAGKCGGQEVGTTVADGGFTSSNLAIANGPFEWRVVARGGTDLRLDTRPNSDGDQAMFANSQSPTRREVVRQYLLLDPGRYRLSWESDGKTIAPDIRCESSRDSLIGGSVSQGASRTIADVTVPATAECVVQVLAITVGRSDAPQDGSWIDQVAIRPIA